MNKNGALPPTVTSAICFQIFFFFFFIFFSHFLPSAADDIHNSIPYDYYRTTDDVAVNCGYLGNSTANDGRQWFGDAGGSRSSFSILRQRGGESTTSTARDYRFLSVDPIPYFTARFSATQFYYTFQMMNPGQKFIRLHFYPSSYAFFDNSRDFFTVEAGPFTLLRNFSASVTAAALGVKYIVIEYCVNVGVGEYLNLTFSPTPTNDHRTEEGKFYAFVNGIEIVSMPTGLYFTRDGDLGVPVVGQNASYIVDNSSALQMVQRLNIGGSYISPAEDFGMFRKWTEDTEYLLGSSSSSHLLPMNYFVDVIRYGNLPVYIVPLKIYYTSRRTTLGKRANEIHNFTWKIPVNLGFSYLVRLHFCDLGIQVREGGLGEFNVLVNGLIAEIKDNVIRFSGGTGVPMYLDYVVMVKGDEREDKKFDLLITLQSSDELVVGLLRGLEVFKLSSLGNNLASPNPVLPNPVSVLPRKDSTDWNLKVQKKLVLTFGKIKAIGKSVIILIIVLNVIIFKLREIRDQTYTEAKNILSAASTEECFHKFSFGEMISATHNFNEAFLIGKGGFGNVYKGYICGGSKIVAVKLLKSDSKQGSHEFWTEIETLSKIRHIHLLPLIGYCNDYGEMILVYEYIALGTLADNIYKFGENGKKSSTHHLTWEQRLQICIGAARGLDYLHTGIEHGVIHRDVKDTNILLDENLVAKISDFGLSKLEKISETKYYVSTKVKGTIGYLDPDYLINQRLTRKSDIYSFGVVLLVVLCGKPAVDRSIPGETKTLVSFFRECTEKGRSEDIIDPYLQGTISTKSLGEFLTCIESCLHPQPRKRSTMAQIVGRLERSLELQQNVPFSISEGAVPLPHVDQFSEDENIQPTQIDQDVTSPIDEVIEVEEEICAADELTREFSELGEKKVTFFKKLFWIRPIGVIENNKGKTMKKSNLFSATASKIQGNEGEILKSRNVKNFGEAKQFTGHLQPDSSPFSGEKASWGALRRRGKHAVEIDDLISSELNPVRQMNKLKSRPGPIPKTPPCAGAILQQFFNLKKFTHGELTEATGNFNCPIGIGCIGSVYKGLVDEKSLRPSKFGNRIEVAVKRLHSQGFQGHSPWLSEINSLGRCSHRNLVQLIGYCLEDDQRFLVYEYMHRGNLGNYIFGGGCEDTVSMDLRIKILVGAAKGLAFLHGGLDTKIIHRDFKTVNILLDKDYNPKLSGFGIAKDGPTGDESHTPIRIVGTFGYLAPEYITTGHLTEKNDVFAYGVVVMEILTGRKVIDLIELEKEQNLVEWAKMLVSNKRKLFQVVDARLEGQWLLDQALKLGNLAVQCLDMDPNLRPTMDEVVTVLEQLQDTIPTTP